MTCRAREVISVKFTAANVDVINSTVLEQLFFSEVS